MANMNGFDANTVEPTTPFDPVPAGKYLAAITSSQVKPAKSGDGSFLELELTILDGACKGRKVWDRLCLVHKNPQTVKIARATLSALCRAAGVMQPKDSVELHNLPVIVTVKCKKRDDTGELANEVKGYARKEAAAGQPPQAPAADNTPPWKR